MKSLWIFPFSYSRQFSTFVRVDSKKKVNNERKKEKAKKKLCFAYYLAPLIASGTKTNPPNYYLDVILFIKLCIVLRRFHSWVQNSFVKIQLNKIESIQTQHPADVT